MFARALPGAVSPSSPQESTVAESLVRRARARRSLSITAAIATVAALAFASAPAAFASDHTSFPGSKPAWAKPANDAGAAPADDTIEGELFFDLKDLAGAESLARAVSTPGSGSYGKYLSPNAWISRFSPDKADYVAVLDYLKQSGFTLTGVPKSRLFVVFRGTADQFNAALGAAMHRYHYRGHLLAAPSKAPTLPRKLAAGVRAVQLDQGNLLRRPTTASPSDGTATAAAAPADTAPVTLDAPCSTYYGQYSATIPAAYGKTKSPTDICGYTGQQFRAAYGVPSGLTGAGQKVAIIDAYGSPTIRQDVNTLAAQTGSAPYSQIVPRTFSDEEACGFPSGWQAEQTLDVIAVHNMAPKASILYVGGFNCGGGIDTALSKVLDDKLANIVTNSYGYIGEYPIEDVQGYENQHLQAIAEGIGLYFSSGDNGDVAALTGTPQPSYDASSPYVTSVGGSTLGIAKNGSVALETGWGSARDEIVKDTTTGSLSYVDPLPGAFRFGAGGGTSLYFSQPWYQQGVVPGSLARGMRVSPDVSADADPYTGELIGIRPIIDDATLATGPYMQDTYGGTSLASPLFAGEVALVQQAIGGRALGFINPLLYGAYKADRSLFRDVKHVPSTFVYAGTVPSTVDGKLHSYLVTNDVDTSLTTTNGYDDVTGLGSLTLTQLRRACARL